MHVGLKHDVIRTGLARIQHAKKINQDDIDLRKSLIVTPAMSLGLETCCLPSK